MGLPEFNTAEFAVFALILLRVSMILFLAPIFGSDIVPTQVKVALALVLTLTLTPVVQVDPAAFPNELMLFVPLAAKELIIGLAIALLIRLLLEGVQLAGQYIGYQMGFAIVNVVNPQTGDQASVLAQLAYMVTLLIFLAVNGHYIVIEGLVDSFALSPPGALQLPPLVFREISAAMAGMFIIAVKISAPALGVLFCAKVSMGIVAKTVPQLNVLFVGMPMYIVVGLLVFGLSLNFFAPILGSAFIEVDRTVKMLLQAM